MIHPKDHLAENPRLKCDGPCGRWMRLLSGTRKYRQQRFYGGCGYTGGDHLCGQDNGQDVCARCCSLACEEIAIARAAG